MVEIEFASYMRVMIVAAIGINTRYAVRTRFTRAGVR